MRLLRIGLRPVVIIGLVLGVLVSTAASASAAQRAAAVEAVPGPEACPAGYSLVDGQCVQVVPAELVAGCSAGELSGDVCIVVGPPPVGGPGLCPDGAIATADGQCYILVDRTLGDCPAGTTPDSDSERCRREVALIPGPLTCSEGYALVDGQCIQVVPAVLVPTCAIGELSGEVCILVGPPPVRGPATCPVGSTVFQDGDECYTLVATNTDGTCPTGTTPDPSGTACRREVALIPGPLTCSDGYALLQDQCVQVVPAELVAGCSVGELSGDVCIVVGPPPVRGPGLCPDGAIATADGQCYILVDRTLGDCPAGTTPDSDSERCRREVALIPGPLICSEGYALVDGQCIQIVPAVLVPTCAIGELSGDVCIIVGPEPAPGPATCPESPDVFQDGGQCFALVDAARDGTCRGNTIPAPNGSRCIREVGRIPPPFTCTRGPGTPPNCR